jgi:hypothetical protein
LPASKKDKTVKKHQLPSDSWAVAGKDPAVDQQVPLNTIGLKIAGWKQLASAAILPTLLDNNISLKVDFSTPEKPARIVEHGFLKVDGKYIRPGDLITVASAYKVLGVPHSKHFHRCWHTNPDAAIGIVIAEWYKNDKGSFMRLFK